MCTEGDPPPVQPPLGWVLSNDSEGFRQTPHTVRKRPRAKPARNCAGKAGAVADRSRGGTIAAHGSVFVPFSYSRGRSRFGNHTDPVGLPRSHTDAGENQTLRANPNMGIYRAPDSHPGLVGRLCHAHPSKLE